MKAETPAETPAAEVAEVGGYWGHALSRAAAREVVPRTLCHWE